MCITRCREQWELRHEKETKPPTAAQPEQEGPRIASECSCPERGEGRWGHRLGRDAGVVAWGETLGSLPGEGHWGRRLGRDAGVTTWGGMLELPLGEGHWGHRLGRDAGATTWGGTLGSPPGEGRWGHHLPSTQGPLEPFHFCAACFLGCKVQSISSMPSVSLGCLPVRQAGQVCK